MYVVWPWEAMKEDNTKNCNRMYGRHLWEGLNKADWSSEDKHRKDKTWQRGQIKVKPFYHVQSS